MKVFRDPLHNVIQFDEEEDKLFLSLIETKEFQRLRFIKQLGFSSFTYFGAEHSRFSHSIGSWHLMKRFVSQLKLLKDKKSKKMVEDITDQLDLALAAALLHDLGHGPFSHVIEEQLAYNHEFWTRNIIKGNTEVNDVLESYRKNFSDDVADVIERTHENKAIIKLLSSQLDVDRMDYLQRDSLMTGAGYGNFDLEWLINCLRIGEVDGQIEVGLDLDKGLSIAEDFVMARYYMYKNVYFHKTTRCAEVLFRSILDRVFKLEQKGACVYIPEEL